jgi:hypothetical protein
MKRYITFIAIFLIVLNVLLFFFLEGKTIPFILNLCSLGIIILLCFRGK